MTYVNLSFWVDGKLHEDRIHATLEPALDMH